MSNLKHTPAPWSFTQVGVFDSKDEKICSLEENKQKYFKERFENLANAKLIASAPELLEALSELLSEVVEDYIPSDTLLKAKNAIKKATE